jgi:hypothetical protein
MRLFEKRVGVEELEDYTRTARVETGTAVRDALAALPPRN